jgi:hypothetical protein
MATMEPKIRGDFCDDLAAATAIEKWEGVD